MENEKLTLNQIYKRTGAKERNKHLNMTASEEKYLQEMKDDGMDSDASNFLGTFASWVRGMKEKFMKAKNLDGKFEDSYEFGFLEWMNQRYQAWLKTKQETPLTTTADKKPTMAEEALKFWNENKAELQKKGINDVSQVLLLFSQGKKPADILSTVITDNTQNINPTPGGGSSGKPGNKKDAKVFGLPMPVVVIGSVVLLGSLVTLVYFATRNKK